MDWEGFATSMEVALDDSTLLEVRDAQLCTTRTFVCERLIATTSMPVEVDTLLSRDVHVAIVCGCIVIFTRPPILSITKTIEMLIIE